VIRLAAVVGRRKSCGWPVFWSGMSFDWIGPRALRYLSHREVDLRSKSGEGAQIQRGM